MGTNDQINKENYLRKFSHVRGVFALPDTSGGGAKLPLSLYLASALVWQLPVSKNELTWTLIHKIAARCLYNLKDKYGLELNSRFYSSSNKLYW